MKLIYIVLVCIVFFSCKKGDDSPPVVYHHFNQITGPQDFGSPGIFDCAEDSAGNFWVGMEQGVAKYDGHAWTTHQFFPSDGSANVLNRVMSVHVDKKGNIWAGVENTAYNYAMKFDGTGWINQYLSGSPVTSILEFANGELWFCTQYTGIFKYDGTNWNFPACQCGGSTAAVVDHQGIAYVTVSTSNNVLIFNGPISGTSLPDEAPCDGIYDMTVSGNDGIFMASCWGAWKYENNTWANITPTDFPDRTSPTSILQDSQGRLWLGTSIAGIFLVEAGKTTSFPMSGSVSKIMQARNGDIYACTGSGFYKFK